MKRIKNILLSAARSLKILNLYHFLLAWMGFVIYHNPSRKLVVIGVTGTKGKTTAVELINHILEKAQKRTIVSSSIRFKVGEQSWANVTGNTMPGRGFLQKLMHKGLKKGCKYAVLEVVSEGIVQHRNKFIDFDIGVFTGLHAEHLESHGGLENYRKAKISFFEYMKKYPSKKKKYFVINKDNSHSQYFIDAVSGENVSLYEKYNGQISIAGDFNRENAGAAIAVCKILGIDQNIIYKTIENFTGVPGRMEFIQKEPFEVVVDYAHTPDSLEAVYRNLKPQKGGLICVLGSAGGGRDKWKRPKMGSVASQYCTDIILTDEDPFDEDPEKIISDIKAGIKNGDIRAQEILDRKDAIRKAISIAKTGDAVIITGKGSELYIRLKNGKKIKWSDKEIALEILASRER
jgi:UDP-N-acetylmuramoyl-L-alanyl-D-glutamate--2,6-diaminopimelate ligase